MFTLPFLPWYIKSPAVPPVETLQNQARRHVVKSGPAEVRASAEGTSARVRGGAREGVFPLLVRVGVGGSPPRKFLTYGCLYVRF